MIFYVLPFYLQLGVRVLVGFMAAWAILLVLSGLYELVCSFRD